ncbi:dynein axonemal assembly factor 1 homolog [Macrobrachium rosenbergii]|uniref:dynein axonemal assembly factor 1 homolog n=1 Tax=Macrobrachium rosenbergii TaxID=79674 RepID=UPI0034D6513B
MTKESLKQLCKEHDLYSTPALNDVLYLHFKGYTEIENLEEYSGLRCLWLENNALRAIKGLSHLKYLRSLHLHHNLLTSLDGLENLRNLVTLNVSYNMITKIDHISGLKQLETLQMNHNRLRSLEDVAHLTECPKLSCVDLSHNHLANPEIVQVLSDVKELRVIQLVGNPVVREVRPYRNTLITSCQNLTYLDDRPVFPVDRAAAEAWKEGGIAAERATRKEWHERDQQRQRDCVSDVLKLRERVLAEREEKKRKGRTDFGIHVEDTGEEKFYALTPEAKAWAKDQIKKISEKKANAALTQEVDGEFDKQADLEYRRKELIELNQLGEPDDEGFQKLLDNIRDEEENAKNSEMSSDNPTDTIERVTKTKKRVTFAFAEDENSEDDESKIEDGSETEVESEDEDIIIDRMRQNEQENFEQDMTEDSTEVRVVESLISDTNTDTNIQKECSDRESKGNEESELSLTVNKSRIESCSQIKTPKDIESLCLEKLQNHVKSNTLTKIVQVEEFEVKAKISSLESTEEIKGEGECKVDQDHGTHNSEDNNNKLADGINQENDTVINNFSDECLNSPAVGEEMLKTKSEDSRNENALEDENKESQYTQDSEEQDDTNVNCSESESKSESSTEASAELDDIGNKFTDQDQKENGESILEGCPSGTEEKKGNSFNQDYISGKIRDKICLQDKLSIKSNPKQSRTKGTIVKENDRLHNDSVLIMSDEESFLHRINLSAPTICTDFSDNTREDSCSCTSSNCSHKQEDDALLFKSCNNFLKLHPPKVDNLPPDMDKDELLDDIWTAGDTMTFESPSPSDYEDDSEDSKGQGYVRQFVAEQNFNADTESDIEDILAKMEFDTSNLPTGYQPEHFTEEKKTPDTHENDILSDDDMHGVTNGFSATNPPSLFGESWVAEATKRIRERAFINGTGNSSSIHADHESIPSDESSRELRDGEEVNELVSSREDSEAENNESSFEEESVSSLSDSSITGEPEYRGNTTKPLSREEFLRQKQTRTLLIAQQTEGSELSSSCSSLSASSLTNSCKSENTLHSQPIHRQTISINAKEDKSFQENLGVMDQIQPSSPSPVSSSSSSSPSPGSPRSGTHNNSSRVVPPASRLLVRRDHQTLVDYGPPESQSQRRESIYSTRAALRSAHEAFVRGKNIDEAPTSPVDISGETDEPPTASPSPVPLVEDRTSVTITSPRESSDPVSPPAPNNSPPWMKSGLQDYLPMSTPMFLKARISVQPPQGELTDTPSRGSGADLPSTTSVSQPPEPNECPPLLTNPPSTQASLHYKKLSAGLMTLPSAIQCMKISGLSRPHRCKLQITS